MQEEILIKALETIGNWETPPTGKFWDREEKEPMSYEAEYGSNGVRDYFKNIAMVALSQYKCSLSTLPATEAKEQGEEDREVVKDLIEILDETIVAQEQTANVKINEPNYRLLGIEDAAERISEYFDNPTAKEQEGGRAEEVLSKDLERQLRSIEQHLFDGFMARDFANGASKAHSIVWLLRKKILEEYKNNSQPVGKKYQQLEWDNILQEAEKFADKIVMTALENNDVSEPNVLFRNCYLQYLSENCTISKANSQPKDDKLDEAIKEDFTCYEIWRPNIPDNGCSEQCKECKEQYLQTLKTKG